MSQRAKTRRRRYVSSRRDDAMTRPPDALTTEVVLPVVWRPVLSGELLSDVTKSSLEAVRSRAEFLLTLRTPVRATTNTLTGVARRATATDSLYDATGVSRRQPSYILTRLWTRDQSNGACGDELFLFTSSLDAACGRHP